ncbi:MAG: sulfite reductase [Chlamydiota bacterium]
MTVPFHTVYLKKKVLLTKKEEKETYLLTFDTSQFPVSYKPGDSAAILPINEDELVKKTLIAFRSPKDTLVFSPIEQKMLPLETFLTSQVNISRFPTTLVRKMVEFQKATSGIEDLLLPENKNALLKYTSDHALWDFLEEFPEHPPLQEICSNLFPLTPRFYSIASSKSMYPNEMHLLVHKVVYTTSNHLRYGVASHYLCDLVEVEKTPVSLYIQPTHTFQMPPMSQDLIMIGPGTGLAPFISFLEERYISKAKGKNWLFFGEWHKSSCFYFSDFLSKLQNEDFLSLDLAFSRDQKEKIYVQHRMREKKKELWSWLENGAYLYVCGDAQKMAKDVDETLHRIAEEEGHLTSEEAINYIKNLRMQKRYVRDVY